MQNLILLPSFQAALIMAALAFMVLVACLLSKRVNNLTYFFPMYALLGSAFTGFIVVLHGLSYWIYFTLMG